MDSVGSAKLSLKWPDSIYSWGIAGHAVSITYSFCFQVVFLFVCVELPFIAHRLYEISHSLDLAHRSYFSHFWYRGWILFMWTLKCFVILCLKDENWPIEINRFCIWNSTLESNGQFYCGVSLEMLFWVMLI